MRGIPYRCDCNSTSTKHPVSCWQINITNFLERETHSRSSVHTSLRLRTQDDCVFLWHHQQKRYEYKVRLNSYDCNDGELQQLLVGLELKLTVQVLYLKLQHADATNPTMVHHPERSENEAFNTVPAIYELDYQSERNYR